MLHPNEERSNPTILDASSIGIEPEAQARIFEQFESLVPGGRYRGFGLGLWIVSKIVEAHGGRVGVWSQSAEGSRFTVELPRMPPRETTDAVPS